MNWLNLPVALHQHEFFAQATDAQRGVWLSLMLYCAARENGGMIIGARTWSARVWMQSTGIEITDVTEESPLWHWSARDILIIHEYPRVQEDRCKQMRFYASQAGKRRTPAKTDAARLNGCKGGRPKTHQNGSAQEITQRQNPT